MRLLYVVCNTSKGSLKKSSLNSIESQPKKVVVVVLVGVVVVFVVIFVVVLVLVVINVGHNNLTLKFGQNQANDS